MHKENWTLLAPTVVDQPIPKKSINGKPPQKQTSATKESLLFLSGSKEMRLLPKRRSEIKRNFLRTKFTMTSKH